MDRLISIRPGVRFLRESPDRIFAIALTHGLEFTGIDTVKTISAVLYALQEPMERRRLIQSVASSGVASHAMATKTVEILERAKCLLQSDAIISTRRRETHDFFAALDREFNETANITVVAPSGLLESIEEAVSKISSKNSSFATNSVAELRSSASEIFSSSRPELVLCWGHSFRSHFCREINQIAVSTGVPTLFGACEGLTGLVGPLVQGQDLPCLNCAVHRLVAASGMEGEPIFYPEDVESNFSIGKTVHHPVHYQYVLGAFALEAAKIVQGLPTVSMGSIWEHSFFDASGARHPILRVPNCGVCRPIFARRLAWNAIHPEIRISESGSEQQ